MRFLTINLFLKTFAFNNLFKTGQIHIFGKLELDLNSFSPLCFILFTSLVFYLTSILHLPFFSCYLFTISNCFPFFNTI